MALSPRPASIMPDIGKIEVVRLPRGWRVDTWAGRIEQRTCIGRDHFATEQAARGFASMISGTLRFPIEGARP